VHIHLVDEVDVVDGMAQSTRIRTFPLAAAAAPSSFPSSSEDEREWSQLHQTLFYRFWSCDR
jgi:hypothetical protein